MVEAVTDVSRDEQKCECGGKLEEIYRALLQRDGSLFDVIIYSCTECRKELEVEKLSLKFNNSSGRVARKNKIQKLLSLL